METCKHGKNVTHPKVCLHLKPLGLFCYVTLPCFLITDLHNVSTIKDRLLSLPRRQQQTMTPHNCSKINQLLSVSDSYACNLSMCFHSALAASCTCVMQAWVVTRLPWRSQKLDLASGCPLLKLHPAPQVSADTHRGRKKASRRE